FEGASAAEIARRDGVPAGTVRWRLKVALDQLRARLGREVDRDRALRALVPIGGTGGGLMIPALKLALPALKVAALGVVAAVGVGATVVAVQHWRAAPAVATSPRGGASPAVATSPSARASDDPPAGSEGDNLLQRAQDAYIHGEYDDAIGLAKQAREQEPAKAARIMGASSCFKGDAAGATEAWQALDDRGRKFIEYVCKRNDVTLPTGDPVM
ncbi:MAG TPA: hypothetical protein VGH63_17525, partial [Polyangia bacterium]